MKRITHTQAVAAIVALASLPAAAQAQTWTVLKNPPSFSAGSPHLMTDGTILVQSVSTTDWYKFTPDKTGSYVNGTWSQVASLPGSYAPLYYGSEVLTDGKLIINGGEYNNNNAVWTTLGAIYDPVKNKWTSVTPPTGWTTIGDAQSTLLGDGTYMLANCCNTDEALWNEKTGKWTSTGTGKADINDEEGWTLLPSGQVLTADANDTQDTKHTEIYTNGKWASAGDSPVLLADLGTQTNSHELGPLTLLPNGTVFAVGATGYTATYTISTGKWTKGPTFPKSGSNYFDEADGPSSLLPDGNVLLAASPGVYNNPTEFFEYDGTNLNKEPATANASGDPSYVFNLVMLPTGQVFSTDFSTDVEIYTPSGKANLSLAPVVTKFAKSVTPGKTYKLTGTYLNGYSQDNAYGDDYQANTNFPLVQIINTASGDVQYAKTIDFSSMLPANPNPVTAKVEIPSSIETGPSTLVVVTNGIPSTPLKITVK